MSLLKEHQHCALEKASAQANLTFATFFIKSIGREFAERTSALRTGESIQHKQISLSPQYKMEDCQPTPYTIPTLPARIPGNGELDKSVGLHVTGRYKIIALDTYRLKVAGNVDKPLELTYDQIRCLPRVTANPLLVCPGLFNDAASWTGVSIKTIIDLSGVSVGAEDLVLVSAEGYRARIPLHNALQKGGFLAYEVNGQTLPILHGFPLRAVLPDIPGIKWVKWLVEIQVK